MAIPQTLFSTDVGAPILDNNLGSFVAILDVFLVTSLGWTKEFNGTNKAVYMQPASSSHQRLLQVIDDGDGGSNNNYISVRGYEAMTDVDNGTNPFPTTAQMPNSYWFKSDNANANAGMPYKLVGDANFFYFIVDYGLVEYIYFFGDLLNTGANNIYNTTLGSMVSDTFHTSVGLFHGPIDAYAKMYIDRYYDGTPTPQQLSHPNMNYPHITPGIATYPNLLTNAINISPYYYRYKDVDIGLMGQFPGLIRPENSIASFSAVSGDTFADSNGDIITIVRSMGTSSPSTTTGWIGVYMTSDWSV